MDGTGQHPGCASAASTLATAKRDHHTVFLSYIEQAAASGKLAYRMRALKLYRRGGFTLGRTTPASGFRAETLLSDAALVHA